MKLEQAQIDQIKEAFAKMQTRDDLLQLMNKVKPLVYGDKAVPFELKQLTWFANPKLSKKRYIEFKIKKKSGAERSIHAPVKGLKSIQKVLSYILQCVFEPHHAAMGFVRNKSIVDNAKLHAGSIYVYNIDLKDFFPSIDQARVWKCLQLNPFNLNDLRKSIDSNDATGLQTGVRKFTTEHNEKIFYKVQNNKIKLINDKKGNFIRYKKRLLKNAYVLDGQTKNIFITPAKRQLLFVATEDVILGTNSIAIDSSRELEETIHNLISLNHEELKDIKTVDAAYSFLKSSIHATIYSRLGNLIFQDVKSHVKTKENITLLNQLFFSRRTIANIIASLCCTEIEVERKTQTDEWQNEKRNVLPQGAPTSPVITNIVCQRLDFLLSGVAKRFGLKYSRYADDITFSSKHNVYQQESDFLKELHRIIAEQGFHIKTTKTRLQKEGYRQEVTGLLVNEKVNVQKRYIKQLRMWLYYWERYGYERAYGFFLQQYRTEKGHVRKGKPDMGSVIAGKLDYLKMVKGADNGLYLKLKSRFDAITVINKDKVIKAPSISLEKTLSIGDFENTYTTKEEAHQQDTNRLRININPIDSAKGQIKLKRKIIIDKGENLPLEEFLENNEKEEKEIDLSKHKPIDVTRFLLNFRASEGLKFLTHDYDKTDSVFDYNSILTIAKKEFNDLSSQFVIPPSLWARINQFAFGDPKKVWRFNKASYKLNWQSPELISWVESNPITHPINNEVFEKGFITPFKKSIEIKSPELEYIFKNKLAENLASKYLSFDIDLIDLDKANFYTNVDAMQVGISYIIKAITQRFNNSNRIRVEFSRKADDEGSKRIIKIVHVGSECNKPLDKKELFQGDLLEAEKALFGICDWSIISKSPDDSVNRLNILFDINSNKMPKEKIDDSLIEGFTHVLTFYA